MNPGTATSAHSISFARSTTSPPFPAPVESFLPTSEPATGSGGRTAPTRRTPWRQVPLSGSIPADLSYRAPSGALRLLADDAGSSAASFLGRLLGWGSWRRDPEAVSEAAFRHLRRELGRSGRAGRPPAPVVLGDAARDPYRLGEAATRLLERLAALPLRAPDDGIAGLGPTPGLDLTLVSRAPRLLWDLPLLRRLDEQHAVTVALPVLPSQPLGASDAGLLERSRALAAAGLAVHWLVDPRQVDGRPGEVREALRRLLSLAADLGVEDVALLRVAGNPKTAERAAVRRVRETLDALRLRRSFPRLRPGRG